MSSVPESVRLWTKAFTIAASPAYTVEEEARIEAARETVERAAEGGHFSDLEPLADFANLARAAERAQALVEAGVVVVARFTTLGPRILVGLEGRLS